MTMPRNLLSLVVLLAASLFLTGCKQHVLYSQLTEQEANEMVSLMYSAGLTAEKRVDKGLTYTVLTDQNSFSHAMELLQANGLPRERFQSLGDVFKKEGFVSSPLEERARLNHALSQEISNTLSNIDGVLMARVHLAVPERDLLADVTEPSSASVMVKHRADMDLGESVAKIKALVVDGVENMPYENVTVALFPAQPYSAPNRSISNDEELPPVLRVVHMQAVAPIGIAVMGVLMLLGGFVWWLRLGRSGRNSVNEQQ